MHFSRWWAHRGEHVIQCRHPALHLRLGGAVDCREPRLRQDGRGAGAGRDPDGSAVDRIALPAFGAPTRGLQKIPTDLVTSDRRSLVRAQGPNRAYHRRLRTVTSSWRSPRSARGPRPRRDRSDRHSFVGLGLVARASSSPEVHRASPTRAAVPRLPRGRHHAGTCAGDREGRLRRSVLKPVRSGRARRSRPRGPGRASTSAPERRRPCGSPRRWSPRSRP